MKCTYNDKIEVDADTRKMRKINALDISIVLQRDPFLVFRSGIFPSGMAPAVNVDRRERHLYRGC